MCWRKVVRAGERDHALTQSGEMRFAAGRPRLPWDEGGRAARAIGAPEPAGLADRPAQQLSGLGHEELAPVEGVEDLQALLGTWRQGNHASPSSAQRGGGGHFR
jgi:hypothetical protein